MIPLKARSIKDENAGGIFILKKEFLESVGVGGFPEFWLEFRICLHPDGMGELGQRDLHGTEFLALPAVDA